MRRQLRKSRNIFRGLISFSRKFTYLFLFFIVLVAFFSVLITANNLSTSGGEIRLLEEKKSSLILTNSLLVNERDKLGALSHIKEMAESKLGMVADPKSFEYLSKMDFAHKR